MNTRLRSLVLPSAFAALLAPMLHASTAHAACATTDPQCSFGKVEGLSASYNQSPADAAVGFNWEAQLFGDNFTVGVGANLRLTQRESDPFFSVDLSSADKAPVMEAYWTDDKIIKLRALQAVDKFATFDARHGLAVVLNAKACQSVIGENCWEEDWDVTDDITFGSTPFEFDAQASQKFAPWASADPFQMAVVGGSVDSSQLFEVSINDLGLGTNLATGDIGVYISTEGTIFNYKTTAAKFNGQLAQLGQDVPLAPAAEYGDELSVRAQVTGSVWIDGKLYAKPYVSLTSVYGYGPGGTKGNGGYNGWPINYAAPSLSIVKDFRIPNAADQTLDVDFPETTLLIPIPNVKPDKTALSMSGKSGKLTLTNTGKKAARVRFQSENSAFQVPGGEQAIAPGSDLEVQVVYTASDAATTQLTIFTNDPDSPQIAVNVGANGASVREPNQDDPDNGSSSSSGGGRGGIADKEDESGCGCHTSGTTADRAGMALLLAGVAAVLRRGRRRSR